MLCLRCSSPIDLQDLEKRPHYGLHKECFLSWFNVPEIVYFTDLTRKSNQSFNTGIHTKHNSFFHGAFKKYSATLCGSSYILKMREKEKGPELPEVEYLCNQIGKYLSIPVAEFYIVDFEGDKIFVTKNFATSNSPSDLQHIYHFLQGKEHNCKNLIQIVAEKTKRPYDVEILVQTILYDALIGNHDRHGRNLAFLTTSNNTALSPIYDNVSYLALEQGNMLKADFNPAGTIWIEGNTEPRMKEYTQELKQLGYKEIIKNFYNKIKMHELENLIRHSFCSKLMKDAISKLINKRFKELEDEIKSETRL